MLICCSFDFTSRVLTKLVFFLELFLSNKLYFRKNYRLILFNIISIKAEMSSERLKYRKLITNAIVIIKQRNKISGINGNSGISTVIE